MTDGSHQPPKERTQNPSRSPVTLAEFHASVLQQQHARPPLVFLIRHEGTPNSHADPSDAPNNNQDARKTSTGSHLDVVYVAGNNDDSSNHHEQAPNEENLEVDCESVSTGNLVDAEAYSANRKKGPLNCASSTQSMTERSSSCPRANARYKVDETLEKKSGVGQESVTTFRSKKPVHEPGVDERDRTLESSNDDCTRLSNHSVDCVTQDLYMLVDMKASRNYSYFDALWGSPPHRASTSGEIKLSSSTAPVEEPKRCDLDSLNSSGNSNEKILSSPESADLNITQQISDSQPSPSKLNQPSSEKQANSRSPTNSQQQISKSSSFETTNEVSETRSLTTVIKFSKDKETYYVDNRCANINRKHQNQSSEHDSANETHPMTSEIITSSLASDVGILSDFGTSSSTVHPKDSRKTPILRRSKKQVKPLTKGLKKNVRPVTEKRKKILNSNSFLKSKTAPEESIGSPTNIASKSVDLLRQPHMHSLRSRSTAKSDEGKAAHSPRNNNTEPGEHFLKKSVPTLELSDDSMETDDEDFDPSFKVEREPDSGLFLCRFCPFKAISEFIIEQHGHLHNGSLVPIKREKPEVFEPSLDDQNKEASINSSQEKKRFSPSVIFKSENIGTSTHNDGAPNKFFRNLTAILNESQNSDAKTKVDFPERNVSETAEATHQDEKNSFCFQVNDTEPKPNSKVAVGVGVDGGHQRRSPGSGAPKLTNKDNHGTGTPEVSFEGYCCRFCHFSTKKIQFMAAHAKVCTNRELALLATAGPQSVAAATEVHAKEFQDQHFQVKEAGLLQPSFSGDNSQKNLDSCTSVETLAGSLTKATSSEICSSDLINKTPEKTEASKILPRVPYKNFAKPFGCPLCPFAATKMTVIRRHRAKYRH